MTRKLVTVLGWIFLLIGVLGFIPPLAPEGMLLGVFMVGAVHNVVHLLTGALALYFARKGEATARTFAKVFAVVYGLVTILGFFAGSAVLFTVNAADNWLHLVITLLFAYAGWAGARADVPMKREDKAPMKEEQTPPMQEGPTGQPQM